MSEGGACTTIDIKKGRFPESIVSGREHEVLLDRRSGVLCLVRPVRSRRGGGATRSEPLMSIRIRLIRPHRQSRMRIFWERQARERKDHKEEGQEIRHVTPDSLTVLFTLHTPHQHLRNAAPRLLYGNVDKKKSRGSRRIRFSARSWKESSRPGRHTTNVSFEKKQNLLPVPPIDSSPCSHQPTSVLTSAPDNPRAERQNNQNESCRSLRVTSAKGGTHLEGART